MPLTRSDADKIGQAIAQQLISVLGTAPEPTSTATAGGKYDGGRTLGAIQADFQAEVMPLIRDFVGDLKAGGHLPSGKQLSEAVIVIA